MALTVAQLVARLTADTSSFTRGMSLANAFMLRKGSIMTGVATGVGVSVAAVGGISLKMAGNFESAMNILQAVSGSSKKEMKGLSDQAIALGGDIKLPAVSAKDAAEAMTALAKGGLGVNDIMGAVRGTLQLGIAANIGFADASTVVARSLKAFGLEGSEATRIADLFTNAANASTAEITDVALGFQQASAQFKRGQQSIGDLTTAITMMADAGVVGSDAGTSLKTMMNRLISPTGKARKTMDELGIAVYDAAGNVKPMPQIVDMFSKKLGGLSNEARNAALYTMFGSDAIRAAGIVLTGGGKKWDEYSDKVNKTGSAQAFAEARTKGFNGALMGFQSQVETLGIRLGTLLLPAATAAVNGLSALAGSFTEGHKGAQILEGVIAGLSAAFAFMQPTLEAIVSGIGQVFQSLYNAIAPTVQQISGFIHTHWATIQRVTEVIFQAIGIYIQAAVFAWTTMFRGLGVILGVVSTIFSAVFNVIQTVVRAIETVVRASITAVLAIIRGIDAAIGIVTRVMDTVRNAVVTAWNAVRAATTTALNTIVGAITTGWNAVSSATSTAWGAIKAVVSGAISAVLGIVTSVGATIVTAAKTVASGVLGAFDVVGQIVGKVAGFFASVYSTVSAWIDDLYRVAYAAGEAVVNGIYDGIMALAGKVAAAAGHVAGLAKKGLGSIWGKMHSPWTEVTRWGELFSLGLIDGIIAGSVQIPSTVSEIARKALEALVTMVKGGQSKITEAFSTLATDALAAFDAVTNSWVPPSQRILNKIMQQKDIEEAKKRLSDLKGEVKKALEEITATSKDYEAKQSAIMAEANAAIAALPPGQQTTPGGAEAETPEAMAIREEAARKVEELEREKGLRITELTATAARAKEAVKEEIETQAFEKRRAQLELQAAEESKQHNASRALVRRHLENRLEDLQTHLLSVKTHHRNAQKEIVQLLHNFGTSYEKAGAELGDAFARGMKVSTETIMDALGKLTDAIAARLKVKSPTKEGPLSTLDHWWDNFADTLTSGLDTKSIDKVLSGVTSPTLGRGTATGAGTVIQITIPLEGAMLLSDSRETADRLAEVLAPAIARQVSYVS